MKIIFGIGFFLFILGAVNIQENYHDRLAAKEATAQREADIEFRAACLPEKPNEVAMITRATTGRLHCVVITTGYGQRSETVRDMTQGGL